MTATTPNIEPAANGSSIPKTPLVVYSPKIEEIEKLKAEVGLAVVDGKTTITALDCTTPDGYKLATTAIATCRTWRGQLEKDRTAANAEALRHQRAVNSLAKDIENKILAVEEPLKAAKKAVDDEKERIAREKAEAAEKAQRQKIEDEAAAHRLEEKRVRDLEEARLEEERKKLDVEREKIAVERKAMEDRQAEINRRIDAERKQREEQETAKRAAEEEEFRKEREREAAERKAEQDRIAEKLAEERAVLEQQRKALAEEAAKQAASQREAERILAADRERERLAKEVADRAEADRLAAEKRKSEEAELEKRRQALLGDKDKLAEWAGKLREAFDLHPGPKCKSKEGNQRVVAAAQSIQEAITAIVGGL